VTAILGSLSVKDECCDVMRRKFARFWSIINMTVRLKVDSTSNIDSRKIGVRTNGEPDFVGLK